MKGVEHKYIVTEVGNRVHCVVAGAGKGYHFISFISLPIHFLSVLSVLRKDLY